MRSAAGVDRAARALTERRRPDTPFWVDRASVRGDRLTLSSEESHHLLHVHRAEIGTPFEAVDGEGGLYKCVLDSVAKHDAVGRIVERLAEVGELAHPLRLLVGMPDRSAVEAVVAHAVPLGASLIDFVACERSGRGPLGAQRLERLNRLARAGVKQSRRTRLPELKSSDSLESGIADLPPGEGSKFFADPRGNPWHHPAKAGIQNLVALAVGPPGGFSEGERTLLLGRGFSPILLGPNRLSTETAATLLVGLARNSLF